MVSSVNDIPLVSMVKCSDEPTVWSDTSRNKYEPNDSPFFHPYKHRNHNTVFIKNLDCALHEDLFWWNSKMIINMINKLQWYLVYVNRMGGKIEVLPIVVM